MLTTLTCGLLMAAPIGDAPNILIVLMDDVGRDKIGAYADHPNPAPTPSLDALAAQGVLFRNAWAYPVCSPTRAALLTGRYGDRTGITTIIRAGDGVHTPLLLSETILPEVLPDHRSLAIGKWHLKD
ncbi:MAG: arylsulfatase B, partial [Planctomycetota bacterium]